MSLPKNLCLAPFAYLTFDPATNVSPCPALGGSTWNFANKPLNEVWHTQELKDLRTGMLNNEKFSMCSRCWSEEAVGFKSERMNLWDPNVDPYGLQTNILESNLSPIQVLEQKQYAKGPMQLAIKVGNICNLRCRSCNSNDSVTLAVEGKYYAEHYGLTNNFYYRETESKSFTDKQIDDIVAICDNVRRIEFYGGEPLLDKQLPRLLQKLVDRGLAKQINLNISTNITQPIKPELVEILSNFLTLNLNMSMDGWGEKFTYLRHPAEWNDVFNRVRTFSKLALTKKIDMTLLPVITVTTMNVHHLPELVANMKKYFRLKPYMILANTPTYYNIRHIPEPIAEEIITQLNNFTEYDFSSIVGALRGAKNPAKWEEFKQWTAMVDDYRKESFAEIFPEYTALIRKYDPKFLL